jgi:hypothetical protein
MLTESGSQIHKYHLKGAADMVILVASAAAAYELAAVLIETGEAR